MRRWIYEILTAPRSGIGRVIYAAVLLLIAANVVASVLETDVDIAQRAPDFFRTFEIVSVIAFSVEYALRLWSCTADKAYSDPIMGRLRYAVRPMALIDFAAIAPFYIELLLPGFIDLRFLRIMRLVRIFRLVKGGPLEHAFTRLVRVVQSKRVELAVSSSVVAIGTLLSASAMYFAEKSTPNTDFTSIPRAMWWAIVTITTVGYGDVTPKSALGRVIGGVVAFLGICMLALPVGIISSGYVQEIEREKTEGEICPRCGRRLHDEDEEPPSSVS